MAGHSEALGPLIQPNSSHSATFALKTPWPWTGADIEMIRESMEMRNGVGVPFIREVSDDLQHIVVRVFVSEQSLPKSYEDRKKTLLDTAQTAWLSVYSGFDLNFNDESAAPDVVIVQFLNIGDIAADGKKVYAEFKNGELSFH